MNNVIIYLNVETNGVVVIYPSAEFVKNYSIEDCARKDVPKDIPYIITSIENLPDDYEYFNAWEADFSNPDGYGIGADAWFAEQEALNDNN